jgi:uncharacterized membrane protein
MQPAMVTMTALRQAFTAADVAALVFFALCWLSIELLLRPRKGAPRSTGEIMARWRMRWFQRAAERDNRIMDAQLVASLRAGVALYVSGSLIALGGAAAMLGQADQVASVAGDIAGAMEAPRRAWTVKLLLVIAVLASAFLHFVWSHRVFGYCSVMLGAIPNDPASADAAHTAARAGRLSVLAARSFNKGLRAVYLSLAALAWLVGPAALAAASAITFWVLYRREFLSETRRALLEGAPPSPDA